LYRLKKLLKKWNASYDDSPQQDAEYVADWVTGLLDVLHQNRNDKDFIVDILYSASEFFNDKFSDQQKSDAFIFLLGLKNRKG
jgi:ubiquitin C-terminal hydrolase